MQISFSNPGTPGVLLFTRQTTTYNQPITDYNSDRSTARESPFNLKFSSLNSQKSQLSRIDKFFKTRKRKIVNAASLRRIFNPALFEVLFHL